MQGLFNWMVLIFHDATIVEVRRLLTEYKQYFFFIVAAESNLSLSLKRRRKSVLSHLKLCKAGCFALLFRCSVSVFRGLVVPVFSRKTILAPIPQF